MNTIENDIKYFREEKSRLDWFTWDEQARIIYPEIYALYDEYKLLEKVISKLISQF
jgi:hypothetical protein